MTVVITRMAHRRRLGADREVVSGVRLPDVLSDASGPRRRRQNRAILTDPDLSVCTLETT